MLRLVQLSRIFMSKPDVVILDQPTKDLDPDNKITAEPIKNILFIF